MSETKISIIAAMDKNGIIGKNNALPWEKLPADMIWFAKNTMGKPIVMGRPTFESLGSSPLANRMNIILTRDETFRAEGCIVFHSIKKLLRFVKFKNYEELMIIGVECVYGQFLPLADQLYLTLINGKFDGDAFFPVFSTSKEWELTSRSSYMKDEKNAYDMKFCVYKRKES